MEIVPSNLQVNIMERWVTRNPFYWLPNYDLASCLGMEPVSVICRIHTSLGHNAAPFLCFCARVLPLHLIFC